MPMAKGMLELPLLQPTVAMLTEVKLFVPAPMLPRLTQEEVLAEVDMEQVVMEVKAITVTTARLAAPIKVELVATLSFPPTAMVEVEVEVVPMGTPP